MAENTHISWTNHTFNPWIGCQKVSPGCDHCYAETLSKRFNLADWGPQAARKRTSAANWRMPIRWNKRAQKSGKPLKVFCSSLADIFDRQAPPGARDDLWQLIRNTPCLIWQLLTKRPQNMARMLPEDWPEAYSHVWLGITAENQQEYDRRWPVLAATPARIRFISYEPALGPLTLDGKDQQPDWVIWGGESGRNPRPMNPDWARTITRECHEKGIPVFGKQWGVYSANPLIVETGLTRAAAEKLDPKKNGKGGALLDGALRREFPAETAAPPGI